MSYNVSQLLKMKNRRKKLSQETRRLEEKMLTKQEKLLVPDDSVDLPAKIVHTKTYDVTSASLEKFGLMSSLNMTLELVANTQKEQEH